MKNTRISQLSWLALITLSVSLAGCGDANGPTALNPDSSTQSSLTEARLDPDSDSLDLEQSTGESQDSDQSVIGFQPSPEAVTSDEVEDIEPINLDFSNVVAQLEALTLPEFVIEPIDISDIVDAPIDSCSCSHLDTSNSEMQPASDLSVFDPLTVDGTESRQVLKENLVCAELAADALQQDIDKYRKKYENQKKELTKTLTTLQNFINALAGEIEPLKKVLTEKIKDGKINLKDQLDLGQKLGSAKAKLQTAQDKLNAAKEKLKGLEKQLDEILEILKKLEEESKKCPRDFQKILDLVGELDKKEKEFEKSRKEFDQLVVESIISQVEAYNLLRSVADKLGVILDIENEVIV